MYSLFFLAVQELENSPAYKVGYEVGYFVGSNFWTFISIAVVFLAAILYLAFFRKRKKNNWS